MRPWCRTCTTKRIPNDKSTWQTAQIRVDAFPQPLLHGHVKTVDTVASQQDFFASDVKVYKTMVSIDEPMEGLKPGMSAEVTIYADESPTEVLVVPVQTVIGTISMGAKRKVFVIGPDGQPVKRDIVVGMTNERKVEVKSGLKEGEQGGPQSGALAAGRQRHEARQSRGKDRGRSKARAIAGKKGGKKARKGRRPRPEELKDRLEKASAAPHRARSNYSK